MKRIKKYFNRFLCRIFGHKRCYVLVKRSRVSRHKSSWRNCKVKMVRGGYEECARCGKKLSNFERI